MIILLPNNIQIILILFRNCCVTLRNSKHKVLFNREHSKSGIHYFLTLKNSYSDVWKKKKEKSQSFKNGNGSDLESTA